ncbi:MAG: ABC transporter permease [Bacteroidales bacterium]|nr:ABC transporter permease [Bacteroidales bacterium]
MNFEFFIAKRIISAKKSKSISASIVKIAIASIVLGLAIMIVSVAIIDGFKKAIREKVTGFSSRIQISNFDSNESLESKPIDKSPALYSTIKKIKGVKHIQSFAVKGGLIKADDIHGVIVKGIDSNYDLSFFKDKISEGSVFTVNDNCKTDKIIVSRYIASKLKLKVNQKIKIYFIQDQLRVYPFTISGIYETGLEEFDKDYVFADIAYIQKLNNWNKNQVGGIEVLADDFKDIDRISDEIYYSTSYNLSVKNIRELYPQIFDWLELQNVNVNIIIILMILVAVINMISALLILIMERNNMIGVLKSLGLKNRSLRNIFLYNAFYIILKGLVFGNILGIVICLIQQKFAIITLPQETYYISSVPISLNFLPILLLNMGTIIVCMIALILPTYVVKYISPIKVLRFN